MRRHSICALSVAAAMACASGSRGPEAAPIASADAGAPADLILRGAQLVRFSNGKTTASARADELRYQRAGGRFEADQVRATLLPGPQARALDSFGAVEVLAPRVAGEESTANGRSSAITRGEGGVSARAARGDEAQGEQIVWDGAHGILKSERPVTLRGPGYSMRGGALEATSDGERFELTQGAQGTLSRAPGMP